MKKGYQIERNEYLRILLYPFELVKRVTFFIMGVKWETDYA